MKTNSVYIDSYDKRKRKLTNKFFETIRQKLIKAFGGFCWLCFEEHEKYEFAHIKETKVNGWGRGRNKRYCDILKNPNSFALFGEECHKIYDNSPFDIFSEQ